MLNQQKPLRTNRSEDGFLTVHSVFQTIQGEGPFAGYPATFVRLYGCNLQCPHCDTEYTERAEMYHPLHLAKHVASMDISRCDAQLVVITGGEPFRQHITPFVKLLLGFGYTVQIETNGVLYPSDDFPWTHPSLTVVCSPKTGKIHPELAQKVHAYKYVLSVDSIAEDGLPITALGHPLGNLETIARPPKDWTGRIFVSPMDSGDPRLNKLNLEATATSVMTFRKYIMGVQMHKIIGLP